MSFATPEFSRLPISKGATPFPRSVGKRSAIRILVTRRGTFGDVERTQLQPGESGIAILWQFPGSNRTLRTSSTTNRRKSASQLGLFLAGTPLSDFIMNAGPTPSSSSRRKVFAGSVGNVLEWYDFAVYGFLAPIMSPLFFPDHDTLSGLINTYGIFAAGYLMRPIGGVIFGHIGDRLGRTKALRLSIAMMAIPTVLVGLLPVHAQAGALAAALLVLLRLIQGISVGGELIGSMSYLVESAPPGRRGMAGSWSIFGGVVGILLGSSVATALGGILGEETMRTWGWRLPFLAGIGIFLIGKWLRRSLDETPEFAAASENVRARGNPLLEVLREMPKRILLMSAGILLYGTSFYMLFVWMPSYLTEIVTPAVDHALLINTMAMILVVVMIPIGGLLSDRIGRKKVMMIATALMGLGIYPLFLVIDHGVMVQALAIQLWFAVLFGMMAGPLPAFMVECFPITNRYTAIGVGYNLTLAIFGGTAPMIATWLIKATGDIASPALYLAFLALISLVAMAMLKPLDQTA